MPPIDQSLPSQGHLPPLQQQFHIESTQDVTLLSSTSRELPLLRSPNPPTPTSHPDPRYSPYQSSYLSHRPEIHVNHPSDQSYPRRPASTPPIVCEAHRVTLPPVQPSSSNYAVSLPPVADLVGFNATGGCDPPKTILERLKRRDSSVHHTLTSPRSIYPPLPSEAFVPVQLSSRHAHLLVKGEPNEESPPFSVPTSRGGTSPPPVFVTHDQRGYVIEVPQIHDLDHSSRFKSEIHGEISDGGTPRKNNESDFPRTIDSDVRNRDMSVRRPLRPW
ncbi:hypothetical protein BDM02DRAFT_854726 [Thelephora ganbajun]|uniref:Uncharacterized protein n=1 Tax=Thelephora ganbajun TaxID=370292 RepID=A0ACB6ZNT2_THEGA|nr:hypothetical protein BDM02DRAFT_854726 [Thelephora ganbajun]